MPPPLPSSTWRILIERLLIALPEQELDTVRSVLPHAARDLPESALRELILEAYEKDLHRTRREEQPERWARIAYGLGNAFFDRQTGARGHNIEQAIGWYRAALAEYPRDVYPEKWALMWNNIGNAYRERTTGNWIDNVEVSIRAGRKALTVYTEATHPSEWAMVQNNIGNAFGDRGRGNQADNIERAIEAYESALRVYTPDEHPDDWTMVQNNLGTTLMDRVEGNRQENIERAIAAYRRVLTIRSKETHPYGWALVHSNMGTAYYDRETGDRLAHLEKALSHYEAALQVFTRKTTPEEWAMVHNNLGTLYRIYPQGDRIAHVEQAIDSLEKALSVYTMTSYPRTFARISYNLGVVFCSRTMGDKSANIERAINSFTQSMAVRTRESYPVEWAHSKHGLGTAYMQRVEGNMQENLETALQCFQHALLYRTAESDPEGWASSQQNLAAVYLERQAGDSTANVHQAIDALQKALTVFDKSDYPYDWALAQLNLGNAYSALYGKDQPVHLENALAYYRNAHQVFTKAHYPSEWADAHNNIGLICKERDDFDQAVAHFRDALSVFSAAANPLSSLGCARNLGDIAYSRARWDQAIEGYRLAVAAVEQSRLWAMNQDRRERLISDAIDVYAGLVVSHVCAGHPEEALVAAERSKARTLVETLEKHHADLGSLNTALPSSSGITLKSMQTLLEDDRIALVEWYVTNDSLTAFLLHRRFDTPRVWHYEQSSQRSLVAWTEAYMKGYLAFRRHPSQDSPFRNTLCRGLDELAAILHLADVLEAMPPSVEQLILIPHRYLHVLPLHALPLPGTDETLTDRFKGGIRFGPGAYLLSLLRRNALNLNQAFGAYHHFLGLVNTQGDLPFSILEVEHIGAYFSSSETIASYDAEEYSLQDTMLMYPNLCCHFSCHGVFDIESPLDSHLVLGERHRIHLSDLLDMDFRHLDLVTLSACESGFTDINSFADEYIGLPYGFLLRGTPTVVSSIWPVQDFATSIFMQAFYQRMSTIKMDFSGSVAFVLGETQRWFKSLTAETALNLLDRQQHIVATLSEQLTKSQTFEINELLQQEYDRFTAMAPQEKPFEDPFYWAAFVALGA